MPGGIASLGRQCECDCGEELTEGSKAKEGTRVSHDSSWQDAGSRANDGCICIGAYRRFALSLAWSLGSHVRQPYAMAWVMIFALQL